MAYDAGSVVFTFEADTTQIDKALQDVKKAASNISGGSSSSKKNQLFENLGLTDVASFRQTYNWLNQITKSTKTYNNMMSNGLDPTNHADILSYQNQISTQMGNQMNYAQILNGNFSSLGVAAASVTATIALGKKGLSTCITTIKTINSIISTTVKYATNIVTEVGNIVYKVSGLESTVNGLKSIFQSLGETIIETFSTDNIEDFIEECIDLGSSLTEVQNVVDTIFGDDASTINSWAETATESLGMAETSAKKYSSTFGAILTSAGVSSDKITEMSTSLTDLTADMASLYNYDYDEMFEKIKSGLSGMVRPLASLGVSLHASTLQDYLDSKGINATYTELSYANKEIVRYNYLIENTTSAQGDFSKTFYTWANQVRYFKEQLSELMTTLGQGIISVLNPLLIYINKIFTVINGLVTKISTVFQTVFGDGENSLSNAIGSVDTSDILDDMESDVEDVETAVKRTVSSFDELHRLNDDSSSNSALDDLDLSSLLDTDYESQFEDEEQKIQDWANNIVSIFETAWETANGYDLGVLAATKLNEIINKIYEFLDNLIPLVRKIAKILAEAFNGFIETFDWTKLGETISKFIEVIQTFLLELIQDVHWDSIGTAFADLIDGIFVISDKDQQNIITRGFAILVKIINGIIESVSSFITEMNTNGTWAKLSAQISQGINLLFSEDGIKWDELGSTLKTLILKVLVLISDTISKVDWGQVGSSFGTMLSNLFEPDSTGTSIFGRASEVIVKLINALITVIRSTLSTPGLIDELKEGFKEFFTNIKNNIDWEGLIDDYNKIKEIIESFFKNAVSAVDWTSIILIAVDLLSTLIKNGIYTLLAVAAVLLVSTIEALGDIIIDALTLIGTAVYNLLANAYGFIDTVMTNLIANIVGFIDTLDEIINAFLDWLGDAIVEGTVDLWTETIWPFLEGVWDKIQEFGDWIVEGWADIIEEIGADLTSLKQTIINIWNGIKSTLTNAWNWLKTNIFDAIKNGVKSMLNSVISTINSLISKLNSISFTMPDWLGGGTFGLSIPTLPLLANGGYIGADMPTAAIIGDNKNEGEIVAPESKIQENVAIALEPYMSKIESLLSTLINSSDEIHVHCEIDGDEITEIVLNNANLATARGGA